MPEREELAELIAPVRSWLRAAKANATIKSRLRSQWLTNS